ncbi:MAG: Zn-dependent hydrolase [Gemmatimonadales bacterium]|nr:Zn-dependent hydrolase [Gemmatimonadales bacterium]
MSGARSSFTRAAATGVLLAACSHGGGTATKSTPAPATPASATPPAAGSQIPSSDVAARIARYTTVRLTADLTGLTPRERQMIPLLIDAAREMDAIYWMQAFGNRDSLLSSLRDPALRRYAEINYGPWDRLANDSPFVAGVGTKPAGAGFYPRDVTAADIQAAGAPAPLRSEYTIVRRDPSGRLTAIPYHVAYAEPTRRAAARLREAARLADDAGLRNYLELRATALETDDYRASDMAWLDMKQNTLDMVVGPIESYEDALLGLKTAHEAYVLIKDRQWSARLARYAAMLPALQRGLPVPEELKRETPGTDSDLNAYDAVYYAGQANAGAKTIAINLPNDEEVQLKKGTRRLQLKNAMRAKFDRILVPIAGVFIAPDQRKHVTFDAFFENTMFHEVAHGLGIKQTINGRGTVRAALKEKYSALEEEKADVLGLYMVATLNAQGELGQTDIMNNYVTFLAGIVRSVRFGASDAHGRANMVTFSFLQERGAFTRDEATGTYRVDQARMRDAVNALAEKILRFQGTGNYAGVTAYFDQAGRVSPVLQRDLMRLGTANIPVDVIFEQGTSVLGL